MARDRGVLVRARLLGTFEFTDLQGQSLVPRSRKATAILAYLAYHRNLEVTRDTLIDLFWFDRERTQGQNSLRQALVEIRNALGDLKSALLDAGRHSVCLDGDAIDFDLWTSDGSLADCDPRALLERLGPISPVFDDWLDQERRVLVTRRIGQAERAMGRAPRNSPEALAAAETILRLETQNETAARVAMTALAAQGELSKAVRVFKTLKDALLEDGFDVSQSTVKVFEELRQSPAAQPATPAAGPARKDGPPLLAILPMRGAEDICGIADRFTDEVTARMTDVREVRTLSKAQGMRLEHAGEAMIATAASLGVDYILSSSANPADDGPVAIHNLFSVPSGEQVWSHRRRLDTANIARSVRTLVDTLAGAVAPAVEDHAWRTRLPENREAWSAWHHYLRARSLIAQPKGADYMDLAEPHLERAIELDPGFLAPYPFLIASYNSCRMNTAPGSDRAAGSARAFELARRFLMLDAQNASAHLAVAWCHLRRRQFDMAERSLERAVELNPYDPNRINSVGTAYVFLGEFDKGEAFYDRAGELMIHDIDFQQTDLGELHYFRREYDRALSYFRVGELRNPLRPRVLLCAALAQADRLAEARAEAEAALEILRARWQGAQPFSPQAALRWYLDDFVLRRRTDIDNLVEGLTKAGFTF